MIYLQLVLALAVSACAEKIAGAGAPELCLPQPCPGRHLARGRTWCPNNPASGQCDKPPAKSCPPGPCPAPPPPVKAHARTYLALDDRNVLDAGGAELVLGPVTKETSDLIAEVEDWE